jgi:hypothetical protein
MRNKLKAFASKSDVKPKSRLIYDTIVSLF